MGKGQEFRKFLIFPVLILAGGLFLSCNSGESRKKTGKVAAATPAAEEPAPAAEPDSATDSGDDLSSVDTGSADADSEPAFTTVTLEKCNGTYGKVFEPIPPSCKEDMVAWDCCKASVVARYPGVKNSSGKSLEDIISGYEGDGYELYNCGQLSTEKVRIMFQNDDGAGNVLVKEIKLSTVPDPASPADCGGSGSKPPANPEPYNSGGSVDDILDPTGGG